MKRSLKRRLFWIGLGLLLYLSGGILFILLLLQAIGQPGEFRMEVLATREGIVVLLVSTILFGIGGYCLRKGRSIEGAGATMFGGGFGYSRPGDAGGRQDDRREGLPEQFKMPQSDDPPEEVQELEADPSDGEGTTCSNCGATNDTEFTFCWNCSSEL